MSRKPRRTAVHVSDLVAGIVGPVAAKRGFATADLVASWSQIAGPRFAACSRPERISWPREASAPGVLVVRVDGPAAVLLQHEAGQVLDRVNTFLGYRAIQRLQIIQGPVSAKPAPQPRPVAKPEELPEAVNERLERIEGDGALRGALTRLAHGVFTDRR